MVEARIRRLPGYVPARSADFDDATSEGGHSVFLWRLGDAFDLWEEQGDLVDDTGVAPSPLAAVDGPVDVPDSLNTTEVRSGTHYLYLAGHVVRCSAKDAAYNCMV